MPGTFTVYPERYHRLIQLLQSHDWNWQWADSDFNRQLARDHRARIRREMDLCGISQGEWRNLFATYHRGMRTAEKPYRWQDRIDEYTSLPRLLQWRKNSDENYPPE